MADQKITALNENTTPLISDLMPLVDDPGGSAATQKMYLYNLYKTLNAPQKTLINGKIVPSVASNNLTVAIKGLDGNDPSATNPVIIRIGDTIRTITAALSVTKNAGTNWCNSGSAELATKEVDYFVYLGYNATDGIVIGFSRISYANKYADFSATTTNQAYCAISTISNAAATDCYENIGRFAATLSAGAGYTWSVPTYDNNNLIQHPIYETRWITWIPAYSGGTMTVTATSTTYAKYQVCYRRYFYNVSSNFTLGGTPTATLYMTIPYYITTADAYDLVGNNLAYTNANYPGFNQESGADTTSLILYRYNGAVYEAGTCYSRANGWIWML